jgi:DME family drug/metabolite transporter
MVTDSAIDVYLFALLAAVFWGLDPVFSKRGLARDGTWMQSTLIMLSTRSAVFWLLLFATAGLSGAVSGTSLRAAVIFGLAGISASAMGRLMFYVGVDRVGSTLSNAFTNTRPLFTVLLAIFWLRETVTLWMGLGVVVLVAGLVVLTTSKGGDLGGWSQFDLLFPLVAAVFFALGNATRRFGFTTTSLDVIQAVTFGESIALVFMIIVAPLTGSGTVRASGRTYGYFLISGIFAAGGLLCLFRALSFESGTVAIVDPLVATAPLFTTLFAAVFLQDLERVTPVTVGGIVVATIGVALIILL